MSKFMLITALSMVSAVASAGFVAAPEIDPGSAITGVTLLLGGVAVLRGRRLRK